MVALAETWDGTSAHVQDLASVICLMKLDSKFEASISPSDVQINNSVRQTQCSESIWARIHVRSSASD